MEKNKAVQPDISLSNKAKIARSELTVFENDAYIQQLEEFIPQAKQRVWIQTMAFDGHGPFLKLKRLLNDASARGIDTRFTTDTYYKLILNGSLYYQPRISKTKREKLKSVKAEKENVLYDLKQHNVPVTITNPPHTVRERLNPARGRNHVKMAIIDNIAFMGDINHLVSKDQPGIMMKVTDPVLVEAFANLYRTAENGKGGSDYEVSGRDGTALLVDGGIPHQSLILDRAMGAIHNAQKSVTITSQFTPDGAILQSLQAAHERDVKISALVADPEKITRPLPKLFDKRNQIAFKRKGFTIPISLILGTNAPPRAD